jgi:plastocyanin
VQLGPHAVFHPSTLEVPAGDVTFFLHAPPENREPHNMAIRLGLILVARSSFLDGGESAVFTVDGLPPGEYRFYCQFEDHLAEGMAGDLTVTP